MADTHGAAPDPNAAPMHHDIVDRFTNLQIAIAVGLGAVAIVLGTILGLVVVND